MGSRLDTAAVALEQLGGAAKCSSRPHRPKVQEGAEQPEGKRPSRGGRRKDGAGTRTKSWSRDLPSERKVVSILRADLHRSSDLVTGLDLEDSIARLAPALEVMRSAVHQYGGIIHREMGDGVFSVFGAPIAADQHAVMACMAAIELLRRIENLHDPSIRVRVGVHSGQVVAGPRQLDYTRMYDFDGPPLIMAERLQAAAEPGQALASESCRSLSQGYIQFGPAQTHVLKGFAEPVNLYPIKGIGELSKWRVNLTRGMTAFVGRADESVQLLSSADAAIVEQAGSLIVVSGEPGVGKSRLVHEAAQSICARGWQSIEVECSSILGHAPLSLLKSILKAVRTALTNAEMEELQDRLPPGQLAALELSLSDGVTERAMAWAALTPRARARAIVEAGCAMLKALIGKAPTLLLVEDLQWSDQASASFIDAIIDLTRRSPLLVFATVRTDGLPAWLQGKTFSWLWLSALGRSAGQAMLDQLLGPSPRLTQLKTRILNHTGAMPLFIEEVCRRLVECGQIIGQWGKFEPVTSDAELAVPLTVQGVIASRIDRLARRDKQLLQAAAAIGPSVPAGLLIEVSGLGSEAFEESTAKLLGASMIGLDPLDQAWGEQREYSFAHELVRQVAYDALLSAEKLALHARILIALEADPLISRDQQAQATLLVHHAVLAQHWHRAADYAVAAARLCVSKSALPDAGRYFEIALQALEKCDSTIERQRQAVDVRIEARTAYANSGKVSRWLSMAKEAEARAKALGDERRLTAATAVRAAALNFCGTPSEALTAGAEALEAAHELGDEGWLGYAEYGLGQAYYVAGRYQEAVTSLDRAYNRFSSNGAHPPLGVSAAMVALLCSTMTCISQAAIGDYAGAKEAQNRADDMAKQAGGALSAIAADFSRGTLLLHLDQVEEAEKVLSAALMRANQHEINLFVPVLACQEGLALLLGGRSKEALQALTSALVEAQDQEHRSAGLRAELYVIFCGLDQGTPSSVMLDSIQKVGAVAKQQGYEPITIETLLAEAAARRWCDPSDAVAADRIDMEANVIASRLGAAGALGHMKRSFARIFQRVLDQRRT